MSGPVVLHVGPDGLLGADPPPGPPPGHLMRVRVSGGPHDGREALILSTWRRLFVSPCLPQYPWAAIYTPTADPGVWAYDGDADAEEWD
jgi:hypothetical protein